MSLDPNIQRSVDEIVFQIKLGKVIPIIGYDFFYNEFENNAEKDFLKALIKIHTEDKDLESKFSDINGDNTLSGYELINEYYHQLQDKDTFKLRLSETIKDQRFNWNLVTESYRKVVSIKHFQFFINATFLNGLELAFNTIRASGKDQSTINSSYQILNYKSYNPDVLAEAAPAGRAFQISPPKPIIYNLFGTHDDPHGDYVLTDADYIELIYDLMVNKRGDFTNFLSYLNEGYILFLGCNFPDWFFRFFIRICVDNRLDAVSPIKRKAVIDSLNSIDKSRSVFINHYGIQKMDIDCNTLVNEIYNSFLSVPGTPDLLKDKFNNNVFISYCRKDYDTAKSIETQLKANYIECFIDENHLETGSVLDGTIKEAIDKCCVLLAVVSNNLSTATEYFCKEWNYAIDSGRTIIPVFKDFVEQSMFLPCAEPSANIRQTILNKDYALGIKLGVDNLISVNDLRTIKEKQYKCKISEKL